jgi:hypothetical protein
MWCALELLIFASAPLLIERVDDPCAATVLRSLAAEGESPTMIAFARAASRLIPVERSFRELCGCTINYYPALLQYLRIAVARFR